MKKAVKIVVDPFCFKQFDPKAGSLYIDLDKELFGEKINDFYHLVKDEGGLKDGYAPFCKHLFINNITDAISAFIEVTPERERFLKSEYEARRENELAVLVRYLDRKALESELGFTVQKAQFLDIILYSKAQIQEENKATGFEDPNKDLDYDYGIVSVKPQDVDIETPMQPITMMRNALGKEYGGSGEQIDFKKYKESVDFWTKFATLK